MNDNTCVPKQVGELETISMHVDTIEGRLLKISERLQQRKNQYFGAILENNKIPQPATPTPSGQIGCLKNKLNEIDKGLTEIEETISKLENL